MRLLKNVVDVLRLHLYVASGGPRWLEDFCFVLTLWHSF